jgi:hypothetical protein
MHPIVTKLKVVDLLIDKPWHKEERKRRKKKEK